MNAIAVDRWVLAFALVLSLVAACAFGLAPALFSVDGNLQSSLREGGGRSSESRNRRRTRAVLAAAEVALAMVLLVAAGLLLRSFAKLMSVSPGFDVQHVVKADISLPRFQYSTPQQWTTFAEQFLAGLQAEPGLRDSAVAVPRPIADGTLNLGFDIVGHPPASAGTSRTANYVSVSPGYFRVMAIPLIAGRLFDERDIASRPRVSLISQAMARMYFPNENPIGKKLAFGFPPDGTVVREVVGIVGDVRDAALGQDPGPMMYVPFAQAPFWGANVVVRSGLESVRGRSGNPAAGASARRWSAGDGRCDDARYSRRLARATQVPGAVAQPVCGDGAGAGRNRDLRGDFLFGVTPHQRDWHPCGAGGIAGRNPGHGPAGNPRR